MIRPRFALALCALLPMLAACPPMAAGFVVFMSSNEFLDHAKVYHVTEHDAGEVWAAAVPVLDEMSAGRHEVQEGERLAQAPIEGAKVYLKVEVWDRDHCRMSIAARKFNVYDDGLADRIYERIRASLGR